jgi:nitroimidazol reductase NimA-like FMN-containing flavoprotein (pyridoxamine 5'-phosphate oxidase superfamily)
MTIDKLTAEEAAEVLKQGALGRLGCIAEGEPYVVPVHYFYDGENIYIHSLPGKKITALRANGRACLQVDDIRDSYHWRSVIAYGNYEEIGDERLHELALAELFRHVPHLTPVESKMTKGSVETIVFRLRVDQLTGVGETW